MKILAGRIRGITLLGVLVSGAFGCQIVAQIDRSQILDGAGGSTSSASSGVGGMTGSASSSSSGMTTGTGSMSASASTSASTSASASSGTGGACVVAGDCPGKDTECQTRTCISGQCGKDLQPAGTLTSMQSTGDCKVSECDGNGMVITLGDNADLPLDNNPCTDDGCSGGIPSNAPKAPGAPCGAGLVCDGFGSCVACNTPSDCPGADTQCQKRACVNATCGFTPAPPGTACSQNGGTMCDGSGACI